MRVRRLAMILGAGLGGAAPLAGCAGLDFDGPGMPYRYDRPYVQVATAQDCSRTISSIELGETRYLKFKGGYGKNNLTAELNPNGTIKTLGQNTDTQGPETLGALEKLPVAVAAALGFAPHFSGAPGAPPQCAPSTRLYLVRDDGGFQPVTPPP